MCSRLCIAGALTVACSTHVAMQDTGSHYGAFPAHDGLWESAAATAHSLPARLAVEHCMHEARGLDVLPCTIRRLRAGGDATSADLLEGFVYPDEVTHVAAGVRWLRYLHGVATGVPSARLEGVGRSGDKAVSCAGESDTAASGVSAADSMADTTRAAWGAERGEAGDVVTGHGRPTVALDEATASVGLATVKGLEVRCVIGRTGAERADSAVDTFKGQRTLPAEEAAPAKRCTAVGMRTLQTTDSGAAGGQDWRQQAVECGSVEAWFHALIRANFCGSTKPPFNAEARSVAGLTECWYLPLATMLPNS
jgi:hypothetical protein